MNGTNKTDGRKDPAKHLERVKLSKEKAKVRFQSRWKCPSVWFFNRTKTVENGCMEWTGYVAPNGYGRCKFMGNNVSAHRFSWSIKNGEIPDGFNVCHHCDNRKCVNPEHLFIGTHQDNMIDAQHKGRLLRTEHCKMLHRGEKNATAKLTNEDVIIIRSLQGKHPSRYVASLYGLTHRSILLIWQKRTWPHIPETNSSS